MQQRVAKYVKPDASTAEKRTYYVRDAQGNVLAAYSAWVRDSAGITWDSFALAEQHIYGSSRVGYTQPGLMLYPTVPVNPHALDSCHYVIFEGWKRYEISNHLGNVLAVVTDRKRGRASSGTNIQWFVADVLSAQQYYPFGMLMPGNASTTLRRQYSLNSYDYRYGFNGKEGDDEVKGDDNQVDFGARPYDPRSGRWWSVDPMDRKYPGWSPYNFVLGNPIRLIDPDGMEPDDIIVNGIVWTPGATGQGNSDFVMQTFSALNNLIRDKSAGVVSTKERTGHVILDFVGENAIGDVMIVQGPLFGNPHRTSEDGTQINFSEDIGIFLQGNNTESGEPGIMSATTLLGHEFGHAWLAQGSPNFNALLEKLDNDPRNANNPVTEEHRWLTPLVKRFSSANGEVVPNTLRTAASNKDGSINPAGTASPSDYFTKTKGSTSTEEQK